MDFYSYCSSYPCIQSPTPTSTSHPTPTLTTTSRPATTSKSESACPSAEGKKENSAPTPAKSALGQNRGIVDVERRGRGRKVNRKRSWRHVGSPLQYCIRFALRHRNLGESVPTKVQVEAALSSPIGTVLEQILSHGQAGIPELRLTSKPSTQPLPTSH